MTKKFIISIFLLLLLAACLKENRSKNPLEHALASKDLKIRRVMDSLAQYEVQIRLTQIDRLKDSTVFTTYDFQVNDAHYFYPASTVKFPIAVLAFEKLNRIDSLHMDMRYYVEGDSTETTFADDVSKIFAVSDNAANNRLLEFLGQDAINQGLLEKGIGPVRISHRLSTNNANEITTKPLVIYLNDSTIISREGTVNKPAKPLELERIEKGIGFISEDSLIQQPFNFGLKNFYPIKAQHALLKRVIFPEEFHENERLYLSDNQREFILGVMHKLPKSLGYDPEEYYDSYVKFLMFGDSKDAMPEHIKIYNKVGYAYGTLTDCAYIVDAKNEVEFMLTATILVNKDGVFNDNIYEYDAVGIPFLAQLGREIHQFEVNRKTR